MERQAGAYAATAQRRHIDLFTRSDTTAPTATRFRLIREDMLSAYEDTGGVIFHAASVYVGVGVMARIADVRVHRITGHWTTVGEPYRYLDALSTYWHLQSEPTIRR